jgi:hypothetical protein
VSIRSKPKYLTRTLRRDSIGRYLDYDTLRFRMMDDESVRIPNDNIRVAIEEVDEWDHHRRVYLRDARTGQLLGMAESPQLPCDCGSGD